MWNIWIRCVALCLKQQNGVLLAFVLDWRLLMWTNMRIQFFYGKCRLILLCRDSIKAWRLLVSTTMSVQSPYVNLMLFLYIFFVWYIHQQQHDVSSFYSIPIYTSFGNMTSTRLDWTSGGHVYSVWYINTILYSYGCMFSKGELAGRSSNDFFFQILTGAIFFVNKLYT